MACACLRILIATLLVFSSAYLSLGEESGDAKLVEIVVVVVDGDAMPVTDANVRASSYDFAHDSVTNDVGETRFDVPETRLQGLSVIVDDQGKDRMGYWRANWKEPPDGKEPLRVTLKPSKRLPVVVTDANGETQGGVKVGAMLDNSSIISVHTNETGEAVLRLPADQTLRTLFASKKGEGFDFRIVSTPRDEAHRAEWINDTPIRLELAESRTIELQLMDDDKPVADTKVSLWLLYKPGEPDNFNISVVGSRDTEFEAVTDAQGVARFEGVPTWDVHPLTFWPGNKAYAHDRIQFDPEEHPDGRKVVQLSKLVPISGQVLMPDDSPAADVVVNVDGASYKSDSFRGSTSTKADGTFEILVAPDELYMLTASKDALAAPAIDGLVARKSQPIRGLEFRLAPATRVHGLVSVGPDKSPVANQRVALSQKGKALNDLEGVELPNPEKENYWIQPSVFRTTYTDENGNYEFFVGPGSFRLSGPSQVKPKKFEVENGEEEREREFDFAAPRPEEGPFEIEVVTGNPPKPVPHAVVDGKYRAWAGQDMRMRTDEHGKASATRKLHRAVLLAESSDGELAGVVEIDEDQARATITLGPRTTARGVAIDKPTGDPMRNTKLQWGRRVHKGDDDAPWETVWGGSVVTDSDGAFEVSKLVPGQIYYVNLPRGNGSTTIATLDVADAEPIELGEIRISPPYKPPTFEERIDKAFASDRDPLDRFEHATKEAQRLRQHVLVVWADRESELTRSWFKLRFEDRAIRNELPNYQVVHVDMQDGTDALLKKMGIELDGKSAPLCCFLDAEGEEIVAAQEIPRKEDEGTGVAVDRAAVMEMLTRYAPEPLDARELLREALEKAKQSDRRVLVQETATWCGPCHLLARFLEENRERWESDYVWIKMDQRWHGADEVMDGIKEGYRGGIPWCAILSAEGELLASSEGPDGNIGFPAGDAASIEHFISMLESTKKRMQEGDIEAIRTALEER